MSETQYVQGELVTINVEQAARPWLAEARRKSAESRATAARERKLAEAKALLESNGFIVSAQ